MEKIIAAFDSFKFSESTRDYAIQLAKQNNAHLVGLFLNDITYTSYKIYDLISTKGVTEERFNRMEAKDRETRANVAAGFREACEKAGLHFSIHNDQNSAIQDLKHESIYADLLVIDGKETLSHHEELLPTGFIRGILGDVQCPVLVVPRKYRPIEKIILLFDGEPSAVYAVKMSSYLLPGLKGLDTEVVSVKLPNTSLHLPDNKLMKEFMKRHYPKATYTVIKGIAEEEIINYLRKKKENMLVVSGAYSRGVVSQWFRHSMADALMKKLELPLFIAHYK